jgi:hypothetical protein
VARLPDAQNADAHTTEAVEARWWHPAEALEHWDAGEVKLMLPTQTTLREIDHYPDCAAVLTAADGRTIEPIHPELRLHGGVDILLPGDVS